MSESDSSNRRAEARRGWWFPVQIQGVDPNLTAVCRDVSGTGMQLALSGPLPTGTRVSLEFDAPGGSGPRTLHGEVVRSEPNDDESRVLWPHKAGVRLDQTDDELASLREPGR